MATRRTYSAEFKQQAVGLTKEPGRTVADVARKLGIDRSILRAWKIAMEKDGAAAFPGNGRPKASEDEILQLRRELAQTRQERDILKKALAYFAKEPS